MKYWFLIQTSFYQRQLTDFKFPFGFRFKTQFGSTIFHNGNGDVFPFFVFQFSGLGLEEDEIGSIFYNCGLQFQVYF